MNSLSTSIQGLSTKEQYLVAMSVGESEVVDSGNVSDDVISNTNSGGDDENSGKAKWILPVILLALLGVFLWYWLNHDDGAKEAAADKKDKTEMTNTADSIANAMNAELKSGANTDTTKGDTSK